MRNWKNILFAAGIFLFIFALSTGFYFINKTSLNESYEIGNTAGNLNNRGLFCERDGIVFFSNAYDNNVLYSMNADETDVKRLNDVGVSSINADSKRIFYSQTGNADGSGLGYIRNTTGMYRCNHKGKDTFCLTKDPVAIIALSGNYLYYQHYQNNIGVPLEKISIDKKNQKQVVADMVSPASVTGATIYYAGNGEDHYLYALDTATDTSVLVWEHPLWNPVYHNGYIFFMDLNNNYSLHRYDPATGEDFTITKDRVDFFNVYGNIIYYQKSATSSPALKRIGIDGTGEEIVKEGVFESVNITSRYAYFNEFQKPVPVYHQSTYGAVNPQMFYPQASAK